MDGVTETLHQQRQRSSTSVTSLEATGFRWRSCDTYLRKRWLCASWKANCLFPRQQPSWVNLLSHWPQTNILTQVPAFHPVGSNASLPPWKWMQWLLKCRHELFSFPNCVKGHQFSVLTFEWDLDQSLWVDASQPVWDYEGQTCHAHIPTKRVFTDIKEITGWSGFFYKHSFLLDKKKCL